VDKKNDRFENDDLLDEETVLDDEAVLEEDDEEFEALLKLAVEKYSEMEAQRFAAMPVPEDCKPSPRLIRRVNRLFRRAEREMRRRERETAREQKRGERRSFVTFRTVRGAIYMTILILICISMLVISVGAVKTCGYEALWSTGIKAKSGILQVPIPVEKARVSPTAIEESFAPEVEPLACVSETRYEGNSVRRTYYNEAGEVEAVFFQNVIAPDGFVLYSDEAAQVRDIFVNDYTGIFLQWTETEMEILWQDGYYAYRLVSFGLSEAELMRMAESVVPID